MCRWGLSSKQDVRFARWNLLIDNLESGMSAEFVEILIS